MKQTTATSTVYDLLQSGARILLALLILLLPKCGLCLVVYFNAFSVLGISITKYFPYLLPALSVLLVLNLVIGYIKAKRINNYTAWVLSLIASISLLINKIWLDHQLLSWLSVGLLMISAVLQIWSSRKTCSRSFI
ncbi:MAG: hypothetical protein ABW007_03340 [Chitinophagaceae bacterium]